jgi:hypothetical protein
MYGNKWNTRGIAYCKQGIKVSMMWHMHRNMGVVMQNNAENERGVFQKPPHTRPSIFQIPP